MIILLQVWNPIHKWSSSSTPLHCIAFKWIDFQKTRYKLVPAMGTELNWTELSSTLLTREFWSLRIQNLPANKFRLNHYQNSSAAILTNFMTKKKAWEFILFCCRFSRKFCCLLSDHHYQNSQCCAFSSYIDCCIHPPPPPPLLCTKFLFSQRHNCSWRERRNKETKKTSSVVVVLACCWAVVIDFSLSWIL